MYSHDELFLHFLECYFGVYFPHCLATREMNTKITLLWALKLQYIHYSLFPCLALFCSPCPSDIIQGPYVDHINLYHNIGHKDRDTIIVFYCMSIIIIEEMSYWLVLHVHIWVVVWGYPSHQQHRWLYCGCVREWCWEIYSTSWLDIDKLGSTLCIYSGLLLGYIT